MRYISLFAGIGGLEHPTIGPELICELDDACRRVLSVRYPGAAQHQDVTSLLAPPSVDFVLGGWPCQDISVAGKRVGINGERSGLFFRMVEVAKQAGAHTIIGENVPNLLCVNGGEDFRAVLSTLRDAGFPYVAWRTFDAREFGLPQSRRRVILVATQQRERAISLLAAPTPHHRAAADAHQNDIGGFYWTAGGRSLCWSEGYVPALKVGASGPKGRSALAVHYGGRVRKVTADECLRLQGFSTDSFDGVSSTDAVRMAGNAVPLPMGQFAVLAISQPQNYEAGTMGMGVKSGFARIASHGLCEDGFMWVWDCPRAPLATNLGDFIDREATGGLSAQASTGLLVRCVQAGTLIPLSLFDALFEASHDRSMPLRGSRSNSFDVLDKSVDPNAFRSWLELRQATASPP